MICIHYTMAILIGFGIATAVSLVLLLGLSLMKSAAKAERQLEKDHIKHLINNGDFEYPVIEEYFNDEEIDRIEKLRDNNEFETE